MKKKSTTMKVVMGAVFVALALALSYLKIPVGAGWGGFGGSIDLVMVPLIVYAVYAGLGWGVAAGLIFGTLKFFIAGGVAVNWESMLLDYSLAYAAVGLAGIFRGRSWGLVPGAVVGCLARFAVHYLSGVTIYAEYMPDEFLNMTMTKVSTYSLLYNGTYMLPNTILAIVICAILIAPLKKFINER